MDENVMFNKEKLLIIDMFRFSVRKHLFDIYGRSLESKHISMFSNMGVSSYYYLCHSS